MSYYGDGIPYYYGGPFATHSSLMTGTGRIHTPLRYAPHLSTISESPLSTYRRYAPSSTSILPPSSRAKRIIDTADIDVSTPRTYQSSNSSPHQRRLRRDRPTIKIRSQAIKDNPALRDHYERREKSIGEQLVEKFLIKEKKPDNQGVHQEELSSRMPLFGFGRDVDDQQQEAIQKRVTRRMTRRRSSADVQMDPEQLEREMVIAQVQAEVLDNLVAEEQAEIEVETRKGTLIHKNTLRAGPIPKKSDTEEDDLSESKKKLQKKIKKRKKTTDKPSPPDDDDEQSINDDDDDDKIKLFKIEACNSVGDFSTILVNTGDKLNDKIEQFRESIHLPSPRAPGIIGKIEEEINQSDEEIVVLPVKKSYVLDKSRNSVYLTLKQQVGKLNEEEEEDDEKHRETADLNHLNELKTNNDVLLIDANIRSKDNTESDVEVVNRDFNNTLESKEELIDENKREKKSLLTGEIDHKNCSISREVCQVDDSDLLEAKKLSTDLEEPWNKNLVNNNNKSFDVIITENSKNFVKQEREKSQDNTKNFNNCLLDDFKKIKDKVVTGDIENTNLKKILNFDNKCKLIDDILEVVDDKIKSHVEIESLPNAKLININVTLDEKKNSFGPIEKEKSLKDCKKVFDDNFVDDKIEKTVNKVEKNIDKLNRSVSLNTDQVSVSKKEKELEPLKNKNLTKLKFSSTDSGIGSIDSDIVCKTPDQSLKKTLTSSKGFSFECDEEIRPKLKQDSSSRETTPEIKENNKIIPVKRVKKKLIATKKLASFEEEPQEKLDLSKKDIVLTRIEKSISLVADETKEKIKDSTDDVDFWSEIKSDKAIKKEKILLKKTASEPSSKISSNENCVKEDQLELNSSLKVSEIKKINKVDELFVNEDKKIDDKINKVVEEKNNEVKEEAKEEEEIKDEKIIKTILESCVKASTLDNKNSNKISPSSTELPEESANDKEKIIELNEQLILQDLEEEEEENKILGKSDMVVDPKVQEEKEEQEKKNQEIENNSLEFVDNSRATIVPSGLVLDKSLPGLKVDASKEEPSELKVDEVIEAIEKKEDKEKAEEDEDESPKTPTNEEEPILTTKISKWDKSLNLFELDNEELLSTTTSTTTETPEKEKEVNASPSVSPQTSPKKKLTKRKKSSQKSGEKSLIRKIRGGDKSSGNNSKNTTLKADKKKLSTATLSSSPRASKKVNQLTGARPQELIKMFYTTPALLLTATPRDLSKVKRVKIKKKKNSTRGPSGSSDSTGSSSSTTTTESSRSNSTEVEDDVEQKRISSTRSNDSGFDGSPRLSTPSQSSDNQRNSDSSDHVHGSGRITPPATNLPRFKKYTVEDFNFLKVLGKGSFGKVLLAELRGTDCVYAVKCLKKDVVLEDDDVECTLIERKVLTLATRHPYLCHLFCTFQTESHLFFVMEYLNGGDLMFHIQKSGRFAEFRARFYAAEIWSGLNFLHKKGIVYRDLKLDNVLLDFEGHIRIADFGMCKLQIFLDRTADTFCGTPDYMAPEIIKGLKYNQAVDWWSFGVLLYEMLTGQSPFSGCDEDELFWSICNERPFIPRYLSQEAMNILVTLLEKDSAKRPLAHEIQGHPFFHAMQWERLERRMLEPPFKPALEHTLDTRYFDTAFTAEKPRLTPVPEQILTSMDQGVFRGFSYTNPNATD